jgi:Rieske Fe-S protein
MKQIERRKFLESACKACLLAGAGILISELSACGPSENIVKLPVILNTVRVPLSSFVNDSPRIVRPSGWFFNIAIRKTATDQYEALLLECTHQQNQLNVISNGYKCPFHGSQFNLDGQVVKGPAELPLRKFQTSIDQGQLVIQLKS